MAVLKVVDKSYKTKEAFYNLLIYIARKSVHCNGYGISLASIDAVYYEFDKVKAWWGKEEEGRRQVRHFIVSFRPEELMIEEILPIAWQIAGYYGTRYQVFYGIHGDTDYPHVHFVVNTVSYVDGKMLSEGEKELYELKAMVKDITEKAKLVGY